VLSALLIKEQNSKENSKTYLSKLLVIISRLQRIIPKLMALQKRWFKHVRMDFGGFTFLGTKRIGPWPYLTLPWVTGCPNMPLCIISLLTFYFLENILFHPLPLLLKYTKLWIWTPQPLGLRLSQRRLFYIGGMPMAMENLSIAQHRDALRYAHRNWQLQN